MVYHLSMYVVAELGDYNPQVHVDGYVSEFRFIPKQVSAKCYLVHYL